MKIGVISDIHGNLYAFQSVLSELKKHKVDMIINAGDNVGYSVFPDQCVELLLQEKIYCAMGNYDDAVGNNRPACGCGEGDENTQRVRLASLQWTKSNTRNNSKSFLKSLPKILQIMTGGKRIYAMHGGLDELNEFIFAHEKEKFDNIANRTNADIFIMGHTHKSFVLELNGKLFVNPGSVGKPAEGSPDSSYGVIDLESVSAQIHRTSYDVEKNVEFVRKAGLPEEIAKSLRTGQVC